MNVTRAFVMRIIKLEPVQLAQFIHNNRNYIHFTSLRSLLREVIDEASEQGESDLAEKYNDLRDHAALYECHQRWPEAVSDVELIVNPTGGELVGTGL